jgi:hypothetical protein
MPMTQEPGGEASEPVSDKSVNDVVLEKQRVARTMLDINLGDLIDPLNEGLTADSDNSDSKLEVRPKNIEASEPKPARVAKTLIEMNLPSLKNIDEAAEKSVQHNDAPARSKPKAPKPAVKTMVEMQLPENLGEDETLTAKTPKPVHKTMLEMQLPENSGEDEALTSRTPKPVHKTMLEMQLPENLDEDQALTPRTPKPVVKTMLEMQLPENLIDDEALTPKMPSTSLVKFLKLVKSKKISKTMLDLNIEGLESLQADVTPAELIATDATVPSQLAASERAQLDAPDQKAAPEKPKIKSKPVREQYTARTMLDHNMLFNAVSESHQKKELEVAARLEEMAKEPPKPKPIPVKADRPASPCAWQWEETDAKEKYRYCAKCQTPVYNFAGMEKTEAEALIFNRENRDKFTLYSRPDGKFMTTDCPLQAKRKKDLIMLFVCAIALLIGVVTILLLMPPAPPPALETTVSAPTAVRGVSVHAGKHSGSDTQSARRGAGFQTFALPEPKKDTPEVHDPDEDGSFWKY